MNNNQRNSLDLSDTQLDQYSDNVILEVLPQKSESDTVSKYVLIKHDYYSSDSENGRNLLSAFIMSLCRSSFSNIIVYLVDSGTLLLNNDNPLNGKMTQLIDRSEMVIADKDSLSYFNIDNIENSKLILQSADSISEDLIYLPDMIILE